MIPETYIVDRHGKIAAKSSAPKNGLPRYARLLRRPPSPKLSCDIQLCSSAAAAR